MGKKGLTVKMSKNNKPFLAHSARHNRAQMQFKAKIGDPVGKCIQAKEKDKSYTLGEKVVHIRECMASAGVEKGMSIGKIDPNSYYWRSREGRVGGGKPI